MKTGFGLNLILTVLEVNPIISHGFSKVNIPSGKFQPVLKGKGKRIISYHSGGNFLHNEQKCRSFR